MYYYTYKITNKVNGHFYIGAHKTSNLNDGYMGSGTALKHAIKKYGADKFEKQILKFHHSQEEMYEHEKELVNADLVLNKKSYNIKLGGHGGFDYVNATNTNRIKNSCLYITLFHKIENFNYALHDP